MLPQYNSLVTIFRVCLITCHTGSRAHVGSCPHVPRALRALVPYVPRALRALVPHLPHVPRALRAPVPHVSCTILTLVLDIPRALTYSRALRASCSACSRALRALVSHVSYVFLYLTCLVFCAFTCCLGVVPYVFFRSSSLTCLRYFKPNMLIYISCLVAFMSCGSCTFDAWAIWDFYISGWG